MSNINHQALRMAAENATPGEWCSDDYYGVIADAGLNANYYIASCSGPDNRANKRFIAAANPATVLALLDEREAQSKRIAELETNLATLAAENVTLRSKAAELAHEASKIYSAYNATITEPDGDFMDMQTLHEMQCIETPATDAFLNEVRAWAFNDLCEAFVRHTKIAGLDDGDLVTVKEVTDALLHCAEQLREGFKQ